MPNVRDSDSPQDSRDQHYRNWDAYETEDEPTPFKDLIQRDGAVCDNCFTLRYTTQTLEWWRGEFGWLDYERWIPFPDENESIPADSVTDGTRLACSNCGHRHSKQRPIPKDLIQSYAENISRTLDYKDIPHDRDVLLTEVAARNTSDNQGRQDSDVFGPAVRCALESDWDES